MSLGDLLKEESPTVNDHAASRIVDLVKLFYSDPENVKKFNEWKKEKAKKEAC